MKEPNLDLLKTTLIEKHPSLIKRNKRFWNVEFVPFVKAFLETQKDITIIHEEDDPHRVEKCSKCGVMVVFNDNYCSNCGTNFKWR